MGIRLFFFYALIAFDCQLHAAPFHKLPPKLYDITPFSLPLDQSIPLAGGISARPKKVLPAGTKVYFEDKIPNANWGHSGAIQYFDRSGNLLEEVPTQLPPKSLTEGLAGLFNLGQAASFSLSDFGGKLRVADPSHFYALLINGHADQRHWNDFSFLYRVLTQIYGYNRANIFVADSVNKDSNPDLDGDGIADIGYESSVQDVTNLLTLLRTKLTADDHLLIVVNDHGLIVDGNQVLVLYDGQMTAADFGKAVTRLPAGKILSIYEQCYSGGFVRPSTGEAKVAMSASTNQEVSWANEDLTFDEFLYHVISAFARQTHDGKPISDNEAAVSPISAQQAFSYAVSKDSTPESPLLESFPNSGSSLKIGFGF